MFATLWVLGCACRAEPDLETRIKRTRISLQAAEQKLESGEVPALEEALQKQVNELREELKNLESQRDAAGGAAGDGG